MRAGAAVPAAPIDQDVFVSYLSRLKRAEWDRYLTTVSEWEHMEYFTAF